MKRLLSFSILTMSLIAIGGCAQGIGQLFAFGAGIVASMGCVPGASSFSDSLSESQ